MAPRAGRHLYTMATDRQNIAKHAGIASLGNLRIVLREVAPRGSRAAPLGAAFYWLHWIRSRENEYVGRDLHDSQGV
jgi:hypothetical protein